MSITRLIIPPALCIFCFLTTAQTVERLSSPDEKITIDFLLQDGRPSYRVTYNSQELIHPSSLGFRFKNAASLTDGFTILETKQETVDEAWKPVWGTVNQIRNHYNQLSVKLQEEAAPQRQLHLHFRAYNDGVAFRYGLPVQPNLSDFEITSEETFFHFNADHSTWWVRNDYDSYEHLYKNTPLSEVESVNTPFTLKTEDGLSISIHEANLTDYAGMTLEPVEGLDYGLKAVLVPWPDGVKVKAVAPHQSPWRTIQIANKPGDLIESHLIQNLNEPCAIKDVSWIKPMIYMGIWWGMHIDKYTWHAGEKHGATTENAIRYIDFASKHGIPALLIEGWNLGWESWLQDTVKFDFLNSYPDFDLEKVVSYGREKSVYIIGHHETGGNVPDYELQMDSAFALYARLGIPAVKTGYAGKIIPEGQHHHGQWMVNHYRKVVELAAKYRITIDAHEPIKPTGISRTYPNMMTREGVRGMEYNAWSDGNPPEHTTIIPFTRMLAGPLDYTPGIFDLTFDEYKKENRVYSTLANQLALYVILYSPLQMAADLPENYERQPAFEFIKKVPATWDDTRVLDAQIGGFVAIARRSGTNWYIGSVTDEKARALHIPLSWLNTDKAYAAEIYADGADADWKTNPRSIEINRFGLTSADTLKIWMAPGGGQAIHLSPASQAEQNSLPKYKSSSKNY